MLNAVFYLTEFVLHMAYFNEYAYSLCLSRLIVFGVSCFTLFQGYFTGTGARLRSLFYRWSKPDNHAAKKMENYSVMALEFDYVFEIDTTIQN